MQVVAEHLDRADVGPVGQVVPDFPFQGWEHQPFPGVRAGFCHLLRRGSIVPHKGLADRILGLFFRRLQGHLQELFPLAPVHRQNAVRRNAPHRLPEVVIHAVYAVFLFGCLAVQDAFPVQQRPQFLPDLRAVAHGFRQDIPCPGQCRLRVRHFFFLINILGCLHCGISRLLQHQPQGQGFQSPFLCHGCPGPAFRPEGTVNIFQFAEGYGLCQLRLQFIGHHALFFQRRRDFLPALFQVPQVFQPFRHLPQHLVIQRASRFLPVPGNKGNRVPRVQQFHRCLHLLRPQLKLPRQSVHKIHNQ